MVRAVACADVPKLTVIVGGSFGAGNYGALFLLSNLSFLPKRLTTRALLMMVGMAGRAVCSNFLKIYTCC